jgi:hypothetical protein
MRNYPSLFEAKVGPVEINVASRFEERLRKVDDKTLNALIADIKEGL